MNLAIIEVGRHVNCVACNEFDIMLTLAAIVLPALAWMTWSTGRRTANGQQVTKRQYKPRRLAA